MGFFYYTRNMGTVMVLCARASFVVSIEAFCPWNLIGSSATLVVII